MSYKIGKSVWAKLLVSAGVLLSGCATQTLSGNSDEPKWVSSPQIAGEKLFGPDAFYGVGKSNYSDLDVGLSEARDEARREVAAALQTEVQKSAQKVMERMRSAAEESAGNRTAASASSTKVVDAWRSKFTANETNLVNRTLNGSTIVATWRDHKSGMTWALAKIDKTQAQRAMIDEFNRAATAALSELGVRSDSEKKKIMSAIGGALDER
ncbi:MAG TPA: hypothetical protein PLZ57_01595 [Pseudobdellovibrionaceae bacterium]|nr:hypothetical protein [Pseudobdellovibrionaceae bacterium]